MILTLGWKLKEFNKRAFTTVQLFERPCRFHSSNPIPLSFFLQECCLLNPALLQVHEETQEKAADETKRKKEVKRGAVVVARRCINYGRGY